MGRESFLNQIKIKNMFWDSRIDSEFRKVWQILNRFCCKVKSCLGISSQGNPDLVLNQQGNWVETQSSSYKVYTALLTQSGEYNEFFISSGELTIGVTYQIDSSEILGGDWTNVGAPNNNSGTYFVATGTTPNSWGTGGQLAYNTGAPVVTVLENTIGNVWFTYDSAGVYNVNSNGLFVNNKTFFQSVVLNLAPTFLIVTVGNVNIIELNTGGNDGELFNTPIEIRVYS
jgi:hypothetical protein